MAIYTSWFISIGYFIIFYSVGIFGDSTVEIRSNSPAILDSTVSFFVKLNNENKNYLYRYEFRDNTLQETRNEIMMRDVNLVYNVTYLGGFNNPGSFTMKVTVYYFYIFVWLEIGFGSTDFTLTEDINGNLSIFNNGHIDTSKYFATGRNLNFTFILYDPNHYFQDHSLSYAWMIDDHLLDKFNSSILYNFTKTGDYRISVIVTASESNKQKLFNATSSADESKWGLFSKDLSLEDPIPRINTTGNTWLQHGDLLNLNIFCNGSSPFRFCYDVSSNKPNPNFTCDASVMYDTCQFQSSYYFSSCGQYYFSIYIANDVSEKRKSLLVKIFDVSHEPQLSVTIIPITCVILVIIILVSGVTYYKKQQQRNIVEVADFDFTHVEKLMQKTFFQRIYDEFKTALRQSTFATCARADINGESSSSNGNNTNRTRSSYGAIC